MLCGSQYSAIFQLSHNQYANNHKQITQSIDWYVHSLTRPPTSGHLHYTLLSQKCFHLSGDRSNSHHDDSISRKEARSLTAGPVCWSGQCEIWHERRHIDCAACDLKFDLFILIYYRDVSVCVCRCVN